jgi:hypothetical protein
MDRLIIVRKTNRGKLVYRKRCLRCKKWMVVPQYRIESGRGNYCSRRCNCLALPRATLEQRFWAKVNKNGPTQAHCSNLGPCWMWTGAANNGGYGVVGFGRFSKKTAHRVAWELIHGPIPRGKYVLHKCDVRSCVNASRHLYLGTHDDNMRDKGERCSFERMPRGVGHHKTKLTVAQVRMIRRWYSKGVAVRTITRRLGIVSRNAIRQIVLRKSWKNVA